jgi:hypothetical protein
MSSAGDTPTLFLAGHRGMVGSAIARQLQAEGPAHHQPHKPRPIGYIQIFPITARPTAKPRSQIIRASAC